MKSIARVASIACTTLALGVGTTGIASANGIPQGHTIAANHGVQRHIAPADNDDCKNGWTNDSGFQNTVWVCGTGLGVHRVSGASVLAPVSTNPSTGHVHVWDKTGSIFFDGPEVTLHSADVAGNYDWNGDWNLPDGDSVCSAWIYADGSATAAACLDIHS
ncbi:hypothetical protein GCM10010211_73660 [Streptomyces albospinus]|uniref:Secreted protein n=1 Tax=Streptomyces albospinus TaxID=285515 RepID=A0ABQ2VL49_9ACTN|nr:hypothetical protein [Streptomyces albospinus]GGU95828.1 hypothetical protein GCM10010211_73660 [Streptomyces albospinus]